ncbi:AAA family ATPase [Streptomyces sp. NPDC002701]|uniref:AAA family ATPase n=1 Tax=Streptomyces sp. NPDC002701 TaxID=3364661 RepID=UPI00367844A8
MRVLLSPEPLNGLVVLIGASGAGKTTLAETWPASQVLSLDALHEAVSDDADDQEATADAVDALHLLLERRMARQLTTVIDATNAPRTATASGRFFYRTAAANHLLTGTSRSRRVAPRP